MKIEIKGKEYEFSFDGVFAPLYTYETVVGDRFPFDPRKTLCMHVLYWCILIRANKEFDLTLDEFMLELNNLSLVEKMGRYYKERMDVLTTGAGQDETDESTESDKKKG